MAKDHADKQPPPTRDGHRAANTHPGAPAKPSPRAAAEQAASNQQQALESGEESPA